jgi:phospholipid transport system substrate-binding protein
MHYLVSTIICALLFATPVSAGDAEEVSALLKAKIDAVMVLLKDNGLDKPQRNEQIIDIITPIFDYKTMAKLSLGKKYWPKLSPEKKTIFSDLFVARLQKSYLDKLDIYTDEKILYGEPQMSGKKAHLPTTLVSKDNRIEVLYKFYRSNVGWKVYDVEIGGVSVIQTYRSQFNGVLKEGSIDDLIEKLKTNGTFTLPEAGEEVTRSESE